MKVIYLKDRSSRPNYLNKTEELLGYDLGSELIHALEHELSEPLDGPEFSDMSATTRDRLRETY